MGQDIGAKAFLPEAHFFFVETFARTAQNVECRLWVKRVPLVLWAMVHGFHDH